MSNVLLGSIQANDVGGSVYTGGGVVSLPTDTTVVNLPADSGGAAQEVEWWKRNVSLEDAPKTGDMAQGGSDYPLYKEEDKGIVIPEETPENGKAPMSKKNLLLFGIGGLVLAYLLFRKK